MKKFVTLALLGSLLFGCGAAQHPVDQGVAQCRIDAVIALLGKVAPTVVADVAAGKVDLVTSLTQAGGTYNDIFAAVRAYRACSPGDPMNPMLPAPPVEQ